MEDRDENGTQGDGQAANAANEDAKQHDVADGGGKPAEEGAKKPRRRLFRLDRPLESKDEHHLPL